MGKTHGTAMTLAAISFCFLLFTTCGGGRGGESSSGGGGTGSDVTPPTTPTGLQATVTSTTRIDLQ